MTSQANQITAVEKEARASTQPVYRGIVVQSPRAPTRFSDAQLQKALKAALLTNGFKVSGG